MTEMIRHSDKCTVICVSSKKSSEADVIEFNDKKHLVVSLNRSVKLTMKWNGKVYEGRVAGLDFESSGPSLSKIVNSRGF
jgi:DNA helicase TIP49 (TBP-interacting protein)